MSFARRADIEKRMSKKTALIQRLAKKMIPAIRKKDRDRKNHTDDKGGDK
jgi:hypothetical protein